MNNNWIIIVPSVLWRCWLDGRKGIRPVKTERLGAGMVICLERGADLHMAQLMPLPLTVFCFTKIQFGFTFLVPAHLGTPGQRAVKRVCVCVCVRACVCVWIIIDTTLGDCMFHGGPAFACFTLSKNSSAAGPLTSAAVNCYHTQSGNVTLYHRYKCLK